MVTLPKKADKQAVQILESVCAVLEQQNKRPSEFSAYVFGSVIAGSTSWADVDILIVADSVEEIESLNKSLIPLVSVYPLHLTKVLRSEFDELGSDAWGELHEIFHR